MDYGDQQRYLKQSRTRAAWAAFAFLLSAFACLKVEGLRATGATIVFALATAAVAISLGYVPDYLHLTVNPKKRSSWAIRIRWRIMTAALILSLLLASSVRSRVTVFIVIAWLLVITLFAKTWVPQRLVVAFLWAGEFGTVSFLLLRGPLNPLLGVLLLVVAAHLAIVACSARPWGWAAVTIASSWVVLWLALTWHRGAATEYVAFLVSVLISGAATAWLVDRASEQNDKNMAAAVFELKDFTGYSLDRIRVLWEVSNQELANNWEKAAIDSDDREKLAQWYRDNSELYLFAISGYNLEYKRIRSNLNVLEFAQGACLDYGAGNGEIILELARREHPAVYYDVDGVTMRFAQWRAEQRKLAVEFFYRKEDLAASARQRSFDTVFSFDVLEHLPDLAGELDFLSSLLAPGGVFVFDVPAGSTKAHPMHLDHRMDVFMYMEGKGFVDERGLALQLPFKKEEKFVYRKPQEGT